MTKSVRKKAQKRSRIAEKVKISALKTGITTVISTVKKRQVIEVFADINPVFLRALN